MRFLPKKTRLEGQSLIGILIAIALFALLSNAIFTLVTSSYRLISFTRSRITARHLAQDKIEFIRNLPYDKIGTQGGIPQGPLPQNEDVIRNGLNFIIKTTIVYIDDEFDLLAPYDLLPTDYKRVRVEVSWGGIAASTRNPVVLVTDIAPKGVETSEGGGTLSILVFNANGEPVPQASVKIFANTADVNVDLELQTQNNGRLILPGAPDCISCYEVTITKAGYSTDRTYSTSEIENPSKSHSTIIEGNLTEISFAIDELSRVKLLTTNDRENEFALLPNSELVITGSKIIGTDSSGNNVYKYEEEVVTNSSGEIEVELEWDIYTIHPKLSGSYVISGSNPFIPFSLQPNENIDIVVVLTDYSPVNLLLYFTVDGLTPIASVSANLSRGSYDRTLFSGNENDPDFGHAFFPDISTGIHQLVATIAGYVDINTELDILESSVNKIFLIPN